jgi:transposase-like protein
MLYAVETDTSETEGARRVTVVSDVANRESVAAESEVRIPRRRQKYSASYKQKIVAHVAELRRSGGELGSYLREEGIYYSMLLKWEKKFNAGNKSIGTNSKEKALQEKIKMLEKELERTRKRLAKTEMIVEFQKKFAQLLNPDLEEEK